MSKPSSVKIRLSEDQNSTVVLRMIGELSSVWSAWERDPLASLSYLHQCATYTPLGLQRIPATDNLMRVVVSMTAADTPFSKYCTVCLRICLQAAWGTPQPPTTCGIKATPSSTITFHYRPLISSLLGTQHFITFIFCHNCMWKISLLIDAGCQAGTEESVEKCHVTCLLQKEAHTPVQDKQFFRDLTYLSSVHRIWALRSA